MPKALIALILLIFALGVYLVLGQMQDFSRFGSERESRVQPEAERPRSGLELRATILDPRGQPLPGLLVELGRLGAAGPEVSFEATDRSYTDAKGRFAFGVEGPQARAIRVIDGEGRAQVFLDLPPSTSLTLKFE